MLYTIISVNMKKCTKAEKSIVKIEKEGKNDMNKFLPITRQDMQERGWQELDFILISGDAYVDHPSFGVPIIARVLESQGYKVGIIPQPRWDTLEDFKRLGRPKYAFLVGSGNIDPMVNHYTVAKKRRMYDSYSPGGQAGLRPDRATIVYCNKLKEAYKDVAVIIGGLEASLRRFAHYDYWSNQVRRSILIDSKADLLIYGMGEKPVIQIAEALACGIEIKYINYIDGTVSKVSSLDEIGCEYIEIESFEEVKEDKIKYAKAFKTQYDNQDPIRGKALVQKHQNQWIIQNKPQMPLNTNELDWLYTLDFQRDIHPSYKEKGVPAITEIKFSLLSERGCFGSCSFCAITFHQGRIVQTRSHESILDEAKILSQDKDFKGYIHDVGGATANFRHASCEKQLKVGTCKNKQCLFPKACKNLKVDHSDYKSLLEKLRNIEGIKKVFVRSGLRYDYILEDKKGEKFLEYLSEHHISGQLKIAPEHISENVLKHMGKPGGKIFKDFVNMYRKINHKLGKNQYMIPYLMSSHPGSTIKDAIILAEYLRDAQLYPEQVQDFYPTPGTLSTTMYYTGVDPLNLKPVYVAKDPKEKAMQRALLQYKNPENKELVIKALKLAHREDLIGFGPKCLIRPDRKKENFEEKKNKNSGFKKEKNKNFVKKSFKNKKRV